SATVVLITALSTFLVFALAPLALLRLYVRRDKISGSMVAGLFLGAALNVMALALHLTARPVLVPSRYDPIWAAKITTAWAVPLSVLGSQLGAHGDLLLKPVWLIVPAWLVGAAVVVVARRRLTRPAWLFAAVMALHFLVLVVFPVTNFGRLEVRYLVAPELMIFAAMAALLLPLDRPDWPLWRVWAPMATLAV